MTDLFLIWSYEHRAWWRPNSRGYTGEVSQAGLYRKEEAEEIVAGHTDPVHEAMLPAAAVFEAFELDSDRRKEAEALRACQIHQCRHDLQLPASEGDPVKLAAQRIERRWGR